MQLNIMSYNDHGLNNQGVIGTLQHYIQGLQPKIDILILQEHKLRTLQAQQLRRRLWRGVKTWCLEAIAGYNNAPYDEGPGTGGVATLLVPKWAQLITDQDSVLQIRAH
jgi:exonuclease III